MPSLLGIAFFVIVLVFGFVIFTSFFGEQISTLQQQAQERLDKQNDVPDIRDDEDANKALRGSDVCDLRINLHGLINDGRLNDSGGSFFTDEKFIYLNDGSIFWTQLLAGIEPDDSSAIDYQWFCEFDDPLASYSWSLKTSNDLTPLDFAIGDETTAGETIRFKFFLEAFDDGDRAFDFDGRGLSEPFQFSTKLPTGSKFPFNWNMSIKLEGVTHDNYDMQYWNENYEVNDKTVNKVFHYDLCRVGFKECG